MDPTVINPFAHLIPRPPQAPPPSGGGGQPPGPSPSPGAWWLLALGMVIMVAIVMTGYALLLRRAARWLR